MKIVFVEWSKYNVSCSRQLNAGRRRDGLISNLNELKNLKDSFSLILVINDHYFEGEYDYLKLDFPFIETILYRRSNRGIDFGAYDFAYQYLKQVSYDGYVVFMNSPATFQQSTSIKAYQSLFDSDPQIGLCGSSIFLKNIIASSSYFKPHIQSYFLLTTMAVLMEVFPNHLAGYLSKNKKTTIIYGEIGFSQKILNQGYSIAALRNNIKYRQGDLLTDEDLDHEGDLFFI